MPESNAAAPAAEPVLTVAAMNKMLDKTEADIKKAFAAAVAEFAKGAEHKLPPLVEGLPERFTALELALQQKNYEIAGPHISRCDLLLQALLEVKRRLHEIGELPDVEADSRGWMARDAMNYIDAAIK